MDASESVRGSPRTPRAVIALAVSAAVVLLVLACSDGESAESAATVGAANVISSSATDEGWFVRTIAPLGDERGLCIDLPGWTSTNINFDIPVLSHTCKHGWWNMDGRFDRAALDEGRLEMPYFQRCLEASSSDLGSPFFVKPCDGDQRQQFTHLEIGQIVLASNPDLCISVADEPHRGAGGDDFWMNGLILDACSEKNNDRQRWAFIEPQ